MMNEVKEKIIALQKYLDSRIIGQKELVKKLIITLLADGHALLEGAPGLAKTKAIKTHTTVSSLRRICFRQISPAVIFILLHVVNLNFEKGRFLRIWF